MLAQEIKCMEAKIFVELNELVEGKKFRRIAQVQIKEKGRIPIHLKGGRHQYISNVYYVPKMKSNILSLGQLLQKGYDILMKNSSLPIRDQTGN